MEIYHCFYGKTCYTNYRLALCPHIGAKKKTVFGMNSSALGKLYEDHAFCGPLEEIFPAAQADIYKMESSKLDIYKEVRSFD